MSNAPPPHHEPDIMDPDATADITDHLLPHSPSPEPVEAPSRRVKHVLFRLYVSHTLSTWNSRMFEFGSVLFLASIFPGTLLYASIYALGRSLSAVLLSSWLGSMVDRSNRLKTIRHSISMFAPSRASPRMQGYRLRQPSMATFASCGILRLLCPPLEPQLRADLFLTAVVHGDRLTGLR